MTTTPTSAAWQPGDATKLAAFHKMAREAQALVAEMPIAPSEPQPETEEEADIEVGLKQLVPLDTIAALVKKPRALEMFTKQGEAIFSIGTYKGEYEIMLRTVGGVQIVPADYVVYILSGDTLTYEDGNVNIWNLLKAYVREFEIANNVQFSDGSWQRVKKLEADINAFVFESEDEMRRDHIADVAKLRDLLKCAVAGRVVITADGKWQAQVVDGNLVIEQREAQS